jgi:peptidoglycan/LPS O-acetylase OafA/YrhL
MNAKTKRVGYIFLSLAIVVVSLIIFQIVAQIDALNEYESYISLLLALGTGLLLRYVFKRYCKRLNRKDETYEIISKEERKALLTLIILFVNLAIAMFSIINFHNDMFLTFVVLIFILVIAGGLIFRLWIKDQK